MPNDDLARMYDLLRNNYIPGTEPGNAQGYDPNDPEEILRRRRRLGGMMSPMSNPYTINFQQPQQQDNGMASDIFSAIGGGGITGGIIPGILSAIFKKRS